MKRHILSLPPGGLASVPKKDRPRIRLGLMVAAGKTCGDLAAETGNCPGYINMILNDERTGYTVRPKIAKAIGFQTSDLWPDTPIKYLEAA